MLDRDLPRGAIHWQSMKCQVCSFNRMAATVNNLRQIYGAERLVPGCLEKLTLVHMLVSYETEIRLCEKNPCLVWLKMALLVCSLFSERFWLPQLFPSLHQFGPCTSVVYEAWRRDKPPPRYLFPTVELANTQLLALDIGRPTGRAQPADLRWISVSLRPLDSVSKKH
jgi:hypothetical protein